MKNQPCLKLYLVALCPSPQPRETDRFCRDRPFHAYERGRCARNGHFRGVGARVGAQAARIHPGPRARVNTNQKPLAEVELLRGAFPVAEDRGFEPLRALTQHAFQACALGRYANPPCWRVHQQETTLPELAPATHIDNHRKHKAPVHSTFSHFGLNYHRKVTHTGQVVSATAGTENR